ncbi:MAG: hypothetical protein ABR600_11105 [Actinomycetota bacterium]
MRLPLPKRVQERLAPLVERANVFLRNWEWTWTRAVVASMAIAFIMLTTTVFLPSWWLYYADQNLRWRSFWLLKLRDLIAAGLIVGFFTAIYAAAFIVQQASNKARGSGAEHRTGGYR